MSEIHQYKLRNGSSPAWYDEGTGPTPDAWHLDCVQPDHIWRTVYQQGHEAALSQPAGVVDGWKLVPVEPTEVMCEAAMSSLGWTRSEAAAKTAPITPASPMMEGSMKVWSAMLAAAPAASGVDTSTNEAWAARAQEKIAAMEAATGGEDDMCPNCVTPWKCNGPHESTGGASVSERARELVKRWRECAKSAANGPMFDGASEYAVAGTYIDCADELESLLSAASDHQQNAAQGGGEN